MPVLSFRSMRSGALLAACLACAPLVLSATTADVANAPLVGEGTAAITGRDLMTETSTLDASVRQRALASPETVQRLGSEMYIRRALAAKAVEQKIDQDPDVQHLLSVVRERVLSDALVRRNEARSRPTSPVLENLARQTYKAQPERFQQPERIQARHILIPLKAADARATAEALRKQALEGANFADLAKKNSKDPGSASQGGDLGLFPRGKMVPQFDEAAFALAKPGDVSQVVETRFGYHVIQLVEKRPAGLQSFDEVKAQLMEEAVITITATSHKEMVRPIAEAAKPNADAIEAFSASYRK